MAGDLFYQFGPFRFDPGGRLLFREGKTIPLAPKVADTLLLLLENAGKVVEKEELMRKVWQDAFIEEGSLTRTISVLRKALGDASEGQEYIATISKRGYRFVAPVQKIEDPAEPVSPAPAPHVDPPQPSQISYAAWWWATVIVIVLIAMGWFLLHPRTPAAPSGAARLLVLPVENLSGDPQHDYVGEGLTEELIAQLSTLDATHLSVIARTSAMSYRGTSKPVDQIGKELRVDYVLESSLRQSGDRVRITAQLVRTQDQSHVWAASYDRTPRDMLSFEDEVARAIATQIHANLAGKTPPRQPKPEAYLPYLEGRYYWNKRTRESLEQAITHLHEAIAVDPNYARAYSALADCYMSLGLLGNGPSNELFARAKVAALTALSLDDSLAEAHTSLAYLKFWQDWDWTGAESEFKKAIVLNPDYATAHQWYAEYLRLMGRFDESIAESNKALELDPLSLVINMESGLPYYFQRQYGKARERFQKAIDLDPNFALAYVDLAWTYENAGEHEKAIAALEKAARLDDTTAVLSSLGEAYAEAGRPADAKRILAKLEQRSRTSYVSPFLLAGVYLGLSDKKRALDLLDQAYQSHDWGMIWLNVGIRYDPVRSDPRFIELLHRMKFPSRSA